MAWSFAMEFQNSSLNTYFLPYFACAVMVVTPNTNWLSHKGKSVFISIGNCSFFQVIVDVLDLEDVPGLKSK